MVTVIDENRDKLIAINFKDGLFRGSINVNHASCLIPL